MIATGAPAAALLVLPAAGNGAHGGFTTFLLALVATIFATSVLGYVAQRARQPAVLGELVAGVLLGASVLGVLDPADPAVAAFAQIGVLLTLEPPTKPMLKEAVEAGFWRSETLSADFPRIQILTIEDIFAGKSVQYPQMLDATFKRAPNARRNQENLVLPM